MSVLISSLLRVSLLTLLMVIIVILFIVGLTIGRKQIHHWKASVICLIICTIVFVLLQFDYMSPIILDIKQFQTDHYEMAVVKTLYSEELFHFRGSVFHVFRHPVRADMRSALDILILDYRLK